MKHTQLTLAIVVALATPSVFAQVFEEELGLEEIIVTARKREETITDIPLAVTAFDAAKIEEFGLQGILDLPAFTPGFQYEKFAGIPGRFDNSPRFRGISVNSSSPTRQTASVFVDGVFVAGGIQGIGLEDVERIEIIKGPQSAFFGRNTFGGAVNYITKTPGEEFGGKVSGLVASRDDLSVQASIDGPLSDSIKGRVTASYRDHGGHYDTPDGVELGAEETTSFGATLFFNPNDNFDAKIRGYYYEDDDGAPAYSFSGLNDHNCGPFGGTDSTVCGDVPINAPNLNTDVSPGLRDALNTLIALNGSNLAEIGLDREATRFSGQFNYTFPGTQLTLSGLVGFNDEEVRLLRDADDTADLAFVSYSARKFEDNSQELRLSGISFDDRLSWSVGANFFDQEFTSNGEFIVPSLNFFAFGGGEPGREEIKTTGIFGSLSYDINDQWGVTLEGRYQEDEVVEIDDITANVAGSKSEFENFLPRAIIEWAPTNDALVYLSYSEGNLPGGFNEEVAELDASQLAELLAIQITASANFSEEELSNIELGWKQNFADGRGLVTLAAFSMERTNQTFRRADVVSDPDSATDVNQVDYFINAGESDITGLEFEGDFQVNDSFQLSGTVAYINSEFQVFNSGVHAEVFGFEDASGQRAERFPEWSGSLSGIFNGQFSGGMDWFARADLFYTGERFADEINLTRADSGTQLNLRAGVQSDSYRLEAFVLNATDDDTPTAIARFRDLSFATSLFDFSTLGYQVGLRDRTQFGVRASYNF